MGSYCELYISNFPIATSKNEIDPFVLSVFQPEDLKTFNRKVEERFQLLYVSGEELEEDEQAIQFFASTKVAIERLEVMGFTLQKAKESFEKDKLASITMLEEFKEGHNSDDKYLQHLQTEISLLKESNFNDFITASKAIIDNKLGLKIDEPEPIKNSDKLIEYLLQERFGLERFPYGYDPRTLIRILCEIYKDNDILTYDVTELIAAGYYESDPNSIYSQVIESINFDYEIGDKFIVLTEGTSDINILIQSLELLYPHLKDYYSFMDFGISNASGSASSLVASIKSFVGAKINNKIIALFDNDTAAEDAIRNLKRTQIPNNIRILQYPSIKSNEDYPTIGPSGITKMDINGLAGSIETYLGESTKDEKGKYYPVQWKGYNSTLNKYQGEILSKTQIQKD